MIENFPIYGHLMHSTGLKSKQAWRVVQYALIEHAPNVYTIKTRRDRGICVKRVCWYPPENIKQQSVAQ